MGKQEYFTNQFDKEIKPRTTTNTVFISNHPDTIHLIPPIFRVAYTFPNTSFVLWEGAKIIPGIDVIGVPISQDKLSGIAKLIQVIGRIPIKTTEELKIERSKIIDEIMHTLKRDRNIFICPGTKANGEANWRNGIGHIIQKCVQENLPLSVSFMYAGSSGNYFTDPANLYDMVPNIDSLSEAHEITKLMREIYLQNYDGRFGPIKGLNS